MKRATYDAFARFYDLEYGHKENDIDFYLRGARSYGSPVLEIGVGTGRVALPLAEAGYSVVGIDNSKDMLQRAAVKAQDLPAERLTLICADMRSFDLGRSFPLCIIPFRAFLHNLSVADQQATLGCIYRHLNPGGVLVFDLFVPLYHVIAGRRWHERLEPEETARPEEKTSIDITVTHEPVRQLLRIRNRYRNLDSGERVQATMNYRYVFRYEMEALLREAGFTVVRVDGDFDGRPYDYRSGIMVFTARRPEN